MMIGGSVDGPSSIGLTARLATICHQISVRIRRLNVHEIGFALAVIVLCGYVTAVFGGITMIHALVLPGH